MPNEIFISYNRTDSAFANYLYTNLTASRFTVWLDREDILGGDVWQSEMLQAVDEARAVILILSPEALTSKYVQMEYLRALKLGKLLIPIRYRAGGTLPDELKGLHIIDAQHASQSDKAMLEVLQPLRQLLRPATYVPPTGPDSQGRSLLLKNVQYSVQTGLAAYLHAKPPIALQMQDYNSALKLRWPANDSVAYFNESEVSISTHIGQVYGQSRRRLLILGKSGAGKSVLLHELAQELVHRAIRDPDKPIPVIISLASWTEENDSLKKWLVDEIALKYSVSTTLAQSLLDQQMIIPLCDGLDEASIKARNEFVHQTYHYHIGDDTAPPLIVTSRREEYEDLLKSSTILNDMGNDMGRAVLIQPLDSQQIQQYLSQFDQSMEALYVALHEDQALYELAQIPFFLWVMADIFAGERLVQIPKGASGANLREAIIKDYIFHAFDRYKQYQYKHRLKENKKQEQRSSHETHTKPSSIGRKYKNADTLQWLGWLAREMMIHDKRTEFYIEKLQVTWISDSREYHKVSLFMRLTYNLAVGIIYGLISGLIGGIVMGLLGGLVVGLVGGICGGIIYTLAEWLIGGLVKNTYVVGEAKKYWQRQLAGLLIGPISGLIGGVAIISIVGMEPALVSGLSGGLLFASFIGQIQGDIEISMVDEVRIYWKGLMNGLAFGLIGGGLGGLFAWLVGVLVFGLVDYPLGGQIFGLVAGLSGGIVIGLAIGLYRGFTRKSQDENMYDSPNQGIERSWKNSIRSISIGIIVSLVFTSLIIIMWVFSRGTFITNISLLLESIYHQGNFIGKPNIISSILSLLLVPIAVSLGAAYFNGLKAILLHIALRIGLSRYNYVPLNIRAFFDYTNRVILTNKSGGGYRFLHRTLQEYFAHYYAPDENQNKRT